MLDQIREAIEASEISRYRIAKDLGIDQGQLSRVVNGQASLSLEATERLCEYLDLEIVIQPKKQRSKKREN